MYVYMYAYINIHAYIYTYMRKHVYICVYIRIYAYIRIYTYIICVFNVYFIHIIRSIKLQYFSRCNVGIFIYFVLKLSLKYVYFP